MSSWFKHIFLGQKPNSEPGSNARRLASRVALFLIVLLVIELIFQFGRTQTEMLLIAAFYVPTYSVFYFAFVVVVVPFLSAHDFVLNPFRLFTDAITSIVLIILSFGLAFRFLGLDPETPNAIDHVYFSAVTFSTLGYGDFSPSEGPARLLAAFEALIGNLHLGIIVGAAFLAASQPQNK